MLIPNRGYEYRSGPHSGGTPIAYEIVRYRDHKRHIADFAYFDIVTGDPLRASNSSKDSENDTKSTALCEYLRSITKLRENLLEFDGYMYQQQRISLSSSNPDKTMGRIQAS
ncbi:hypothetical protein EWB00_009521 [Schistosoma japonicum]|uniref:Uncharacterized protein n=1 Tax=Schistosoma japonicum TaxID=6182 RepID=A0A4Z2DRG1_SCHJA|nr:hypothetical protein EWB00_009521 [Schistosoma japonicum]